MVAVWQAKAARNHQRIKRFYLDKGRTEQQWLDVSADLQKFNLVWWAMLRLPASDMPPPVGFR